jgi:type I restriction enzyme S subunit
MVDFGSYPANHFDYYEIADVDSESGSITSSRVSIADAPSRAKYAVKAGDILVSTVGPNRKGIAIVPETASGAVCSSGFCVLRAATPQDAYFVRACLTHDIATEQMMRWNTGATYPAIERSVPLGILIPAPDANEVHELGSALYSAAQMFTTAQELVQSAMKDVAAVIDGVVDEAALLAGGRQIHEWFTQNEGLIPERGC